MSLMRRRWNRNPCGVRKVLHKAFKLVCVLTTLSLVLWCCYEFYKNEDVCEVLFKVFHEDEDSIYPELSFSLPNRFNETALRAYNSSFNEENYKLFLHGGAYWDEKMVDVDFNEVKMQLKEFELGTCIYETYYAQRDGLCKNDTIEIKRFDLFERSVFSLHLPSNIPMYSTTIKLKNSFFFDGIRPAAEKFYVNFGYPNQLYRSMSSAFSTWPLRNNGSTKSYRMMFNLKSLEVLRKRQKKDKPCYDKDNYDGKIVQTLMENVGCSPPIWAGNHSYPPCKTNESLKKIHAGNVDQFFRVEFLNGKKYLDPCLNIEKIQIDYVEDNIPSGKGTSDDDEEGWFTLEFIVLTNKFKEIKQVRKYSIQSLVGNAGGYIGLCLGYALWNVPIMIMDLWKHMKRI